MLFVFSEMRYLRISGEFFRLFNFSKCLNMQMKSRF